jgi:high-affinity Fe2+/Pb2+ permease
MSDGRNDRGGEAPEEGVPIVGVVVEKTSRFSKEVIATMISLATAAFGVVAALAWNSAITALFTAVFGTNARISALFVYAVLITLIGVVVIVVLGRIAARISAQPVEFKYPGVPKS